MIDFNFCRILIRESSNIAPTNLVLTCAAIASGCTSTQDRKAVLKAETVKTSARAKNETAPVRVLPKQQDDKTSADAMSPLEAAISREYESYTQYPRRAYPSSTTTGIQKKYADECIDKILNLSESTLKQLSKYEVKQLAQVILSIEQTGMIEKVEISRSSGNKGFDETLLKIIRSIEPFPEFPAALKARVDILTIVKSFPIASATSQGR